MKQKSFASPTPRHSFDPAHGGWGAWEIAFRIGDFSAEHALYNDGFASSANSAREVRERVGGVNWYLNRLFKVGVDYGNSSFTGGNRSPEKVIILRFQINFI